MALFFNNFNQQQNNVFFNRQNKMLNNKNYVRGYNFNNTPQFMQQANINGQLKINPNIKVQPLTQEELKKINEEIQENIKNSQQAFLNEVKNKDEILNSLQNFIQNERNSTIFYNSLANKCNNSYYKNKLEQISKECDIQKNILEKYYKSLGNEDFKAENVMIDTNIQLKQGLLLAIEEELESYNKICNILDENCFENTKEFYKMALKKLSRINAIQFMAMAKDI